MVKKDKKIEFGILTCSNDYEQNLNLNKEIYTKIQKEFGNFCILNLTNLKLFQKKDFSKTPNYIFSNIKIYKPHNGQELKAIFQNKKFIAFNNLGKSFSFFKIYFYLKKINLKQILLMNIGYPQNKTSLDLKNKSIFFTSAFFFLRKKFIYYIFRILTILEIFPKIDVYFESKKNIVKAVKSGLSSQIEKLLPFTKLSYFRKVYIINSRAFKIIKKNNISNRYLCFIDSNFCALDRVLREGKINNKDKKLYYYYLKKLFFELQKIFKKKMIICVHPKNNDKIFYSYFKKFTIRKYETSKIITKSAIVLFHDSSAITDAILQKKNIISLNSELLGNYLNKSTKLYSKILGTHSIELDKNYQLNKTELIKKLNITKKKMNFYVKNNLKSDGNRLGKDKIVDIIKKEFL
jgi:hypothetical protein